MFKELSAAIPPPLADIRRILIFGNSGFIGRHVERVFRQNFPTLEILGSSAPELDLTREEQLREIARFFDSDTLVIMLAGVKRQLGDTVDTFCQNVEIAANLCRLLERQPVRRLLLLSSAAVYGEEIHNTGITEETPVHPTSYYGTAKYATECLFEKALRSQGQSSLLILRPALIYGPGDTGSGYGPSGFVKSALSGEPITLWGDGSEKREFLFVEDVADLVCRLAMSDASGVLNVASGQSYTYTYVLEIVSRVIARPIQTNSRPRTKNKADHGFCNARLTRLLPDFSFTPPAEGIRRLISSLQTS